MTYFSERLEYLLHTVALPLINFGSDSKSALQHCKRNTWHEIRYPSRLYLLGISLQKTHDSIPIHQDNMSRVCQRKDQTGFIIRMISKYSNQLLQTSKPSIFPHHNTLRPHSPEIRQIVRINDDPRPHATHHPNTNQPIQPIVPAPARFQL